MLLLIHGPNLNLLGKRDPRQYGSLSLADIEGIVKAEAKKYGLATTTVQSNHEGVLIDWIQQNTPAAKGIIINPGAFTHYSYAIHDAIVDSGLPCVEVHLSDIHAREEWRRHSVIKPACIAQISGKKERGYIEAVQILVERL